MAKISIQIYYFTNSRISCILNGTYIHAARLQGFKYGKIYYLEIVVGKKETSWEPWGS